MLTAVLQAGHAAPVGAHSPGAAALTQAAQAALHFMAQCPDDAQRDAAGAMLRRLATSREVLTADAAHQLLYTLLAAGPSGSWGHARPPAAAGSFVLALVKV